VSKEIYPWQELEQVMRVVSLGSGSSGNALLVEAGPRGRTRLLVDAGFSTRIIAERLQKVGVSPAQLQGVLVTHEHSDHVLGLPVLMKRYGIPVITNPKTCAVIEEGLATGMWRSDSGKLIVSQKGDAGLVDTPGRTLSGELLSSTDEALTTIAPPVLEQIEPLAEPLEANGRDTRLPFIAMEIGSSRVIGDLTVTSFPISHDAVAPCGYLLSTGGCRVCVVTDSGEVTPPMLDMMRQADLLVLESNHDRERLLGGPYPYALKMRILSATGHLSNDQAADAVLRTWRHDSVRWLWLSHLSRTNNTPTLALNNMRARLQAARANLAQIHISVSPPGMGHVWDSTQLWHAPSLWDMQG
jgi:phosphoribosyl 1,2-cyclic phosphodiesterase